MQSKNAFCDTPTSRIKVVCHSKLEEFKKIAGDCRTALGCPPEHRTRQHIDQLQELGRTNQHLDRLLSLLAGKTDSYAVEENILRHSQLRRYKGGEVLDCTGKLSNGRVFDCDYFFTVLSGRVDGYDCRTNQHIVTLVAGDGAIRADWPHARWQVSGAKQTSSYGHTYVLTNKQRRKHTNIGDQDGAELWMVEPQVLQHLMWHKVVSLSFMLPCSYNLIVYLVIHRKIAPTIQRFLVWITLCSYHINQLVHILPRLI